MCWMVLEGELVEAGETGKADGDPLKSFGKACRLELKAIRAAA